MIEWVESFFAAVTESIAVAVGWSRYADKKMSVSLKVFRDRRYQPAYSICKSNGPELDLLYSTST